eukprot:750859-Hanusia_phi.AAC.5
MIGMHPHTWLPACYQQVASRQCLRTCALTESRSKIFEVLAANDLLLDPSLIMPFPANVLA